MEGVVPEANSWNQRWPRAIALSRAGSEREAGADSPSMTNLISTPRRCISIGMKRVIIRLAGSRVSIGSAISSLDSATLGCRRFPAELDRSDCGGHWLLPSFCARAVRFSSWLRRVPATIHQSALLLPAESHDSRPISEHLTARACDCSLDLECRQTPSHSSFPLLTPELPPARRSTRHLTLPCCPPPH